MKRLWCTTAVLLCASFLAAQDEPSAPKVSYALRNNDHYMESLKQRNLARLTFEEGDYDKSAWHSSEAERYAKLSDDYIARRLLEAQVSRAISEANDQLLWARINEAATYYPTKLANAEAHFGVAVESRLAGDLHAALENALAAKRDLDGIAAPPPRDAAGKIETPPDMPKNPNQYIVRPWDKFGDCFWNIAVQFYGHHRYWTALYEANKDKIPDPKNPNLIEVGTVLDIPSIGKETRDGMYDTGKPYQR